MISKLSCNCRVATRKLPARHSAWQKRFPFSPVHKFLLVLYICHWLILWQNVQNTSARTCLSQSNSVRRKAVEPSLLKSPSSHNVFWLGRMFFVLVIQKVIVTLFFFFQNVWLWDGKRHKDKKVNSRVVLTFIFYYCYMDRQRERGRISDFLDIRPFYIRTDTVYIWYKNWPDIRISFSHCSEDLLPLVKTSCHEKI